jgi:NTP pyrophosphatase (non-canonical NTP hydrolase)
MDRLDKISRISELLTRRFGDSSPFMIMTRLAEEVGELAKEVNHFEASGVKSQKMGDPNKADLAKEAQDVIRAVLQLVQNYEAQAEFEKSIDDAHLWFEEKYKNP